MLRKIIILLACTLLLATLFNIANAEEGVCIWYDGNGRQINSTAEAVTNDACGADLKASSCCSNTDLALIQVKHEASLATGAPTKCANIEKVRACGKCFVKNQKYITDYNGLKICKSFCEKLNSACSPITLECDTYPETNCFNSVAINKVSAFVMTLVVMMLGIFAL